MDTSWQRNAKKYNQSVGDKGHYYHQHVVIPNSLELLDLDEKSILLDLGCGQGVLPRSVEGKIQAYVGVDAAAGLIAEAKKHKYKFPTEFKVADATSDLSKTLGLKPVFTHAAFILSLQNMSDAKLAINNASKLLVSGNKSEQAGKLLIVLNHPAFRIPRQSGWDIDDKSKQQQRWVNRYMSELKIPIDMNPGAGFGGRGSGRRDFGRNQRHNQKITTWSFHLPLSAYSRILREAGFAITEIAEWVSDKESVGRAAKMENRSRAEIPLFMAILAEKQN